MRRLALSYALLLLPAAAFGHDVWIQTNTNLVRVGDAVHVDLMLGNHGNGHRDFKLAGKLAAGSNALEAIDPDGERYDLAGSLADVGYTPQEGFWSARVDTAKPGTHLLAHTSDRVMSYAPERSIKSAKALFVAAASLDRPTVENPGFDRVLGHPLELVPVSNPVTPMGPGTPIKVKLLYNGKPLAGERVAFIPRGAALKEGVDDRYERVTDAEGVATFEPTEANYYLIAAHKTEADQGGTLDGKDYKFTKYGATLTVLVPKICACCGG